MTDRLIARKDEGSGNSKYTEELYQTEDDQYNLHFHGEPKSKYGVLDKYMYKSSHGKKKLSIEKAKDFVKEVYGRIPDHIFEAETVKV